jgi:hypothetical protein
LIPEIARDILELVIDGPEGDSVWAAFQSEQDEDGAIDEEELEAHLIGDKTRCQANTPPHVHFF